MVCAARHNRNHIANAGVGRAWSGWQRHAKWNSNIWASGECGWRARSSASYHSPACAHTHVRLRMQRPICAIKYRMRERTTVFSSENSNIKYGKRSKSINSQFSCRFWANANSFDVDRHRRRRHCRRAHTSCPPHCVWRVCADCGIQICNTIECDRSKKRRRRRRKKKLCENRRI